jgi:hypothetical protein
LVKRGFRWGRLLGLTEQEALAFLDKHEPYGPDGFGDESGDDDEPDDGEGEPAPGGGE